MSRRFYLYEGTKESRDEAGSYETKAEAIAAAKISVSNARDMDLPDYVAHVIDRETGEFLFTAEFDDTELERTAKTKFQKAEKAAHDYYERNGRVEAKLDRWLTCASALDNAGETACEHGFKSNPEDYPKYWRVAVGSLESLLCEGRDRKAELDRKFFRKFDINP